MYMLDLSLHDIVSSRFQLTMCHAYDIVHGTVRVLTFFLTETQHAQLLYS